jgi:hypothetical protein
MNTPAVVDGFMKGDYRAALIVEGNMMMTDRSIIFTTIPFGCDYDNRFRRLAQAKLTKTPADFVNALDRIHDDLDRTDETRGSYTEIKFKRGINPFDHLETVKTIMGMRSKMSSHPVFLDPDMKPQSIGPGRLMQLWYEARKNAVYVDVNKTIEAVYNDIRKYEALIIVQSDISTVVDILTKNPYKMLPSLLMERFGLTRYQANVIIDIKVASLSTDRREEFKTKLDALQEELPKLKAINVDDEIRRQVLDIKQSYVSVCGTTYNRKYCGIALRGNDVVFITEPTAVPTEEWKTLVCAPYFKYIYSWNGFKFATNEEEQFSKYMQSPLVVTSDRPLKYTVSAMDDEQGRKCISYTDSLVMSDQKYMLAGDHITIVNALGMCKRVLTRSLPYRKSVNATGNLYPDFVHMSNVDSKKRLAFLWSPKEPKTLRVSKLFNDEDRLNSLIGYPFDLVILPFTHENIVITVDSAVFKNNGSSTLLVNRLPEYKQFLQNDSLSVVIRLNDVKAVTHKSIY